MARKIFLQYPCGKLFELKFPIFINTCGKTVMPNDEEYFIHAKQKFEINNLVVIQKDVGETQSEATPFISLIKKKISIE